MNYKEYEKRCNDTKLYADEVAMPYVVLGLCGEIGELYEKIEQEEREELGRKEVGDCLWYLAMIRCELGLSVLEDWPPIDDDSEVTPFALPKFVGQIAEQTKKFLRDDWKVGEKNVMPEKRKVVIEAAWIEIAKCLAIISRDFFNSSIEQIAGENIAKLASRKERHVIQGSGDER